MAQITIPGGLAFEYETCGSSADPPLLMLMGFGSQLVVRCGRRQLTVPYLETFAAVAPGELVAFTDSAGLISLAVNAGDAAQQLGLPPGAHVRLAAAPPG